MASTPYKTLGDITSAVCRDFKEATNSIIVAQIQRWSNEAVENWALRKKRDFLNKTFNVQLEAYLSTTWSIASGATLVTLRGTGTIPVTSLNDHKITFPGFPEVYDVSALSSTSVTLASPFKGTTNTAAAGIFFQSAIYIDSEIRSIQKVYHEYDTWPMEQKGVEDFRDSVTVYPQRVDYGAIWSLYGYDLGAGADQRRLLIYPYPKVAYTLHLDVNLYVSQMAISTDEPPIPLQHRQMIYWYAMSKMASYHGDFDMAAKCEQTYNLWLAKLDGEFQTEQQYPTIGTNKDLWIGRSMRSRNRIRFIP